MATLSTTPAVAGTETIVVYYGGDSTDVHSSVSFSLTTGQATPTITWADPANITVGAALGAAA